MAEKMACGLGIPTGSACRGYSLDEARWPGIGMELLVRSAMRAPLW